VADEIAIPIAASYGLWPPTGGGGATGRADVLPPSEWRSELVDCREQAAPSLAHPVANNNDGNGGKAHSESLLSLFAPIID